MTGDLAPISGVRSDVAVRTVLGDLALNRLGPTNYHEHLFQVSPLLPGDELEDEERSGSEAGSLRDSGFATMVDATPIGLGRRPAALSRISAATGLTVIAATGAHREAHYATGHWLLELGEDDLATRFVAEIETGLPERDPSADDHRPAHPAIAALTGDGRPVRAGLIKAGVDYWSISAFEHRVLAAVGQAHVRTGAPVMVHLEFGSAAFEVLALLERAGVPASRVVLAHIDRNPDPGLHAELAAAGAFLGYDGFGRHRNGPDSVLIDCLRATTQAGAGSKVLLGGDVARSSRYLAYGGMPGLARLGERVLPRLREAVGTSLVQEMLINNPADLLGWVTIPDDVGVAS